MKLDAEPPNTNKKEHLHYRRPHSRFNLRDLQAEVLNGLQEGKENKESKLRSVDMP